MKYNTTFIQHLLIHYMFKRLEILIFNYILILKFQKKSILILNMFIYKLFYEKKTYFLKTSWLFKCMK